VPSCVRLTLGREPLHLREDQRRHVCAYIDRVGAEIEVRLQPYGDGDFGLTVALDTDATVKQDLGGVLDTRQAEAVHRERLSRMRRGELFYTVRVADRPAPIGVAAVFASLWDGAVIHEAGVMMLPGEGGRGLGLAVLRQLAERARIELRLAELHGFTAVDNRAGNAVSAKLGGTLLGECDQDYEGRPLRCNHWMIRLTP
jgi:RimJ/RimL family protein N-acetyltransferase